MTIDEYRNNENKRLAANKRRMEEDGVIFVDIYSAYIDEEAVIEKGVTIAQNVTIKGKSVIKAGAYIGQSSVLHDAEVGRDTTVEASYVYESQIGERTSIGPFAYIRPGSVIGDECKVGDFVEVKNSTIGNGSKSAHLTYIGDADIGENVNLGCGVVFVNYDGTHKYRSKIADDAFIGCNSNLVSPVEVGEGAYVAAATTVTENIPGDALSIGRSRMTIKENWVRNRKILKKDNK